MIPIVESIAEMRRLASRLRHATTDRPQVIGFVPTMGALHEGHLSLVRAARAQCDRVIVSIFVNPLQFGANEDFSRYPRDLDRDRALLETVGCDAVFAAGAAEMYPPDFHTVVANEALASRFEGAIRPGHFQGVLTVVAKLFHIVAPDVAYFGQKDAQQALLIRRMARDLDFPLAIEVCPIAREPDGLAMSSRNVFLTPEGRVAARAISRALRAAEAAHAALSASATDGKSKPDVRPILAAAQDVLAAEPRVTPDYVALVDPETLRDVEVATGACVLLIAAKVDGTRLLDNAILGSAAT